MDLIWNFALPGVVVIAILIAIAVAITAPLYITAWVVTWIKQVRDTRGFRIVNPQTPFASSVGESPDNGEGLYEVRAIIPQNGTEVELKLQAPTLATARATAERKGFAVTRIEKLD